MLVFTKNEEYIQSALDDQGHFCHSCLQMRLATVIKTQASHVYGQGNCRCLPTSSAFTVGCMVLIQVNQSTKLALLSCSSSPFSFLLCSCGIKDLPLAALLYSGLRSVDIPGTTKVQLPPCLFLLDLLLLFLLQNSWWSLQFLLGAMC